MPNSTASSTAQVQSVVEELLARLGCAGTVTCTEKNLGGRIALQVAIETPESRWLIGQHGTTLQALQHVVRLLVSSKTNRPCFATLDINRYRTSKEEHLMQLAQEMAEKAARTDSMVIMRPMTSFERRVVHMVLQDNPRVTTESLGQEPNRRVVVKPARNSRVVSGFQDKGLTLDDIKL